MFLLLNKKLDILSCPSMYIVLWPNPNKKWNNRLPHDHSLDIIEKAQIVVVLHNLLLSILVTQDYKFLIFSGPKMGIARHIILIGTRVYEMNPHDPSCIHVYGWLGRGKLSILKCTNEGHFILLYYKNRKYITILKHF